jgi:hypothetical protein
MGRTGSVPPCCVVVDASYADRLTAEWESLCFSCGQANEQEYHEATVEDELCWHRLQGIADRLRRGVLCL